MLRRRAPYYAYRAGSAVARALPGPMADGAAKAAGAAMAYAMRNRRAVVARHLQRVHGPQLTGVALDRAVRRSFDSYARYWVETFRLPSMSLAEIDAGMSYTGLGHLDAGVAAGNGVILALPHLGGWDFGGAWFGLHGYRATVVAEPVEPPELFDWFAQARRAFGLEIVALGPGAGTAVLATLRAGGIAGLVCDRDILGGGVEVEFFGERTTLPGGPATLALRTGACILPVAVFFEGRRGHRGVIRPPIPIERTGRLRDDVARVTQLLAYELEAFVRQAPEQWHLFQPNWPSDPGYRTE